MKGVYLVIMLIAILIVSLLVGKTISKHEPLQGDVPEMEVVDRAQKAAELLDRKNEELQKQLDEFSR